MNSHATKGLGTVFWVSSVIISLFVLWGALAPNNLANNATMMFDLTTRAFGWFYLLAVVFFIFFCFYLAFSRYGKIKLGRDDQKPDFTFFTWLGMLFSAGFGVGLVFWGVAEPMSHYATPPMGVTPKTAEAARVAMRYAMFHWGIHQWAIFTVVGLSLAYFQFRKNYQALISSTLFPLVGEQRNATWGKAIDIFAVISTTFGVATSLGLGIVQINGGLKHVFGIPNSALVQLMIILVLLALYLLSSTTGLDKGIKLLSNLNLSVAFGLMLFALALGPTIFILESFTLGLGEYLQRFFEMSLRLTPYTKGTWVRDWTIFYWAWAIAWAPFVGAFIARISRGRTIREFVIGVLLVPALVGMIWMAVFGGSALHLEMFQNVPIADAVEQDVSTALFITLEQFPFSYVMSLIAILLIVTFLVTSADSATFVLGMLTTNGALNPATYVKIIWGVLQAAIAAVLLLSSGLQGLQTASLLAAMPFTLIMVAMCFALLKDLKQEVEFKKKK